MTCCQIIVKKFPDEYGIKVGDVKKLVPNLGNENKYITEIFSCICR